MNNHQPSPKIYLNKPCCRPKQLTPPSRTRKYGSDFFKILHYCYHMKRRLGKTMSNRAEMPDLELEHDLCMICGGKKTHFCGFWRKKLFYGGKACFGRKNHFCFWRETLLAGKIVLWFLAGKIHFNGFGKKLFFQVLVGNLVITVFAENFIFVDFGVAPVTSDRRSKG